MRGRGTRLRKHKQSSPGPGLGLPQGMLKAVGGDIFVPSNPHFLVSNFLLWCVGWT